MTGLLGGVPTTAAEQCTRLKSAVHHPIVVRCLRCSPGVYSNQFCECHSFRHRFNSGPHWYVNLLLETDPSLARIPRNNGKTVLNLASRMYHVEVVAALLNRYWFQNRQEGSSNTIHDFERPGLIVSKCFRKISLSSGIYLVVSEILL